MSKEDPHYLPVLKIPCRVIRNPTYFTKYLPELEERELNNSRPSGSSPEPNKVKLPAVLGKSVQKHDSEKRTPTFRYDTAYGNAFLVRQLLERQLNLDDVANVYVKHCPTPINDYYTYKPKVKRREFQLWESRKDVKYYQGQIDKRLVEAKQRINKTWKRELREYFRKEKRTENVILRKAESIDKGLKAYLKNVDKQIKKYESEGHVIKIKPRKCNGRDDVKKQFNKWKKKVNWNKTGPASDS
ncbi:unnamed protein product [Mytilus coruscus]|uniref:Uncharacterized protein n=1 Tax=Mytilus coruscus TaxID=42192 RepID=A0A6J8DVD1_MYTCO|nr:unnamed protein product [Mytilus coruscus]